MFVSIVSFQLLRFSVKGKTMLSKIAQKANVPSEGDIRPIFLFIRRGKNTTDVSFCEVTSLWNSIWL